jgi:nucleotide-binding universal stress UspA family protein
VGDDFSGEAEWAGELAARIGGLFDASALLVLGFPSPGVYSHAETSRVRASKSMFGDGGELLRRRAVRLGSLLTERPAIKVSAGDAAIIIRETAAESEKPTLVAVGSRSLDALRRLALGSVSTDILRTASGPVLVFPSAAKDREAHRSRSAVE